MTNCSFCGEPTRWGEKLNDDRVLCAACRPCEFFKSRLTLVGDYGGQPFELMPWAREVVRDIFGTLDDEGLRQYRDVYLEMPTGQAKTTLCAGIALFCLIAEPGSGIEVYSAATAKEQAAIVFRSASQMVRASRKLSALLKPLPSTKRIVRRDDPTSFYAAISADGDVNDGMAPSFVVRDELHRWRSRRAMELNEVLERKVMKRRNALVIDITTSGEVDESPLCWRRHEYTRQIKEGVFTDRRFYGRIWAADQKRIESDPEFWKSREARVQASPSHEDNGGYIRDSDLEALCIKAQNDPIARADYLRYHLGIWGHGNKENPAIEMPIWLMNHGGEDMRNWPEHNDDTLKLLISRWGLIEQPCYAGVDLAWTTDLVSVVFVFPPFPGVEQWTLLPFFWMPQERVVERERKDHVPYGDWVRRGFITATPGNETHYEPVRERIMWGREMFQLREVDFDPWSAKETQQKLADEGIECFSINQDFKQLSDPTKKLLALYLDHGFRHANHPVLNWNAACLSLKHDDKDNVQPIKPRRSKSAKRIDGIGATITGMVQPLLSWSKPRSVYEERGLA